MPSITNLYRPGALSWTPDADATNAPEGSLLRATNLVPDATGSLSLRRGSSLIYDGLESGGDVHTLYTSELLDGTTYRVAGVDDAVYINGVAQATVVTGSGDLAVGDDSAQIFIARGSTKLKWDGTTMNGWGVTRPLGKPEVLAVSAVTSTIADFNNSESPATTITEGSGTVGGAADQGGNANEATRVTPDGTGKGVIQRLWTTDQDFFNVGAIAGSETDLIDFYVRFENPRNVDKVKVVFGIDDSSTEPFKTNKFEFTFEVSGGLSVPIKDLESQGYATYDSAVSNIVDGVNPWEITGFQNPAKVKETLKKVGKVPVPKSKAPGDNVWAHLTVSRGQFERVGNDADRGWDTVRGFKIIYTTLKGKSSAFTISDAIVVGGGARCLTGTYRCVIQAIREFKDSEGNTRYFEKSPPSQESDPVNLNHQAIQITINSTTISAIDSQADQIWIYLFGGWLDSYYRFVVVPAQPGPSMTIDELTTPAGSDLDEVYERARIPSWGFSYSQLNGSGVPEIVSTPDLVVSARTTELEALTNNQRLEPYLVPPPDNAIGVAGPWRSRMFVLTSEGYVYPSSQTSPSTYNSLQVLDLSKYGDPFWIAKTGTGVYVGCEKDVIFLAGTGDNSEDLAQIALFGQELNVGNPPIDKMHWVEGNSIIYRSSDGLQELTGGAAQPLATAGTSLLWRQQDRHGISALNVEGGRFRAAIDNYMLYMLAPEGDDTSGRTIYRYSYPLQQWSRLDFARAGNLLSIFNDPDGTLLAGDDEGNVWKLEDGTQDNDEDISLDLLTPISDGGNPLSSKDPLDLQLHTLTDGDTLTLSLFKDGAGAATSTYDVTTSIPEVWRAQARDFGNFIKAQIGLTGNASNFTLSALNLSYRPRPQRMMALDTGYWMPPGEGDSVWAQEVEVDGIILSSSFTVEVYAEDELVYTSPAQSAESGRRRYQVPLPRGTKGTTIRVVVKASDSTGTDSNVVGLDIYSIRLRLIGSGNQDSSRGYQKIWPSGEAP